MDMWNFTGKAYSLVTGGEFIIQDMKKSRP